MLSKHRKSDRGDQFANVIPLGGYQMTPGPAAKGTDEAASGTKRALSLLEEALEVVDSTDLPEYIGARLQEIIDELQQHCS